jgi:hypothetical protein
MIDFHGLLKQKLSPPSVCMFCISTVLSSPAQTLGSLVVIPLEAWMFAIILCYVSPCK